MLHLITVQSLIEHTGFFETWFARPDSIIITRRLVIHSHNFTVTTMSDRCVETLGIEIRFWSVLETSLPFPPNNVGYQRVEAKSKCNSGGWISGSVIFWKCLYSCRPLYLLCSNNCRQACHRLVCTIEMNQVVETRILYTIEIGSIELIIKAFCDSHFRTAFVSVRVNISVNISQIHIAGSGS